MRLADVIEFRKPKHEDEMLLPCPFCGSNEIVYTRYTRPESDYRWAVVCMCCMAEIDPGYAQQRHVVREMWNRRM